MAAVSEVGFDHGQIAIFVWRSQRTGVMIVGGYYDLDTGAVRVIA